MSIDWKYSSAAIPPGVMTDMPFQLDAPGIYKVGIVWLILSPSTYIPIAKAFRAARLLS